RWLSGSKTTWYWLLSLRKFPPCRLIPILSKKEVGLQRQLNDLGGFEGLSRSHFCRFMPSWRLSFLLFYSKKPQNPTARRCAHQSFATNRIRYPDGSQMG